MDRREQPEVDQPDEERHRDHRIEQHVERDAHRSRAHRGTHQRWRQPNGMPARNAAPGYDSAIKNGPR